RVDRLQARTYRAVTLRRYPQALLAVCGPKTRCPAQTSARTSTRDLARVRLPNQHRRPTRREFRPAWRKSGRARLAFALVSRLLQPSECRPLHDRVPINATFRRETTAPQDLTALRRVLRAFQSSPNRRRTGWLPP